MTGEQLCADGAPFGEIECTQYAKVPCNFFAGVARGLSAAATEPARTKRCDRDD